MTAILTYVGANHKHVFVKFANIFGILRLRDNPTFRLIPAVELLTTIRISLLIDLRFRDARTLSVEGSFGVFGGVGGGGGGGESENSSRDVPFRARRSTAILRAIKSSVGSLALTSGLCGGVSA
jgi:hypothetical protein